MTQSDVPRIITVDDDINSLKSLEELLRLRKWEVFPHLTPADVLKNIDEINPHAAIFDFFISDMTGVDLMKRIHETRPDLPVVILTGSRDVKTAVEALKAGAYHYLLKPVQPDELFSTIDKIIRQAQLREENLRLRERLATKYGFENIVGRSEALKKVFRLLDRAIATKSTILFTGESGTGKELFAQAVHYNSPRSDGPFIKVNCAAIPDSLLEPELFGIEKQVATGVAARPGKFELADGGSIFLDEIGDMSPATQAKVLRVLQEREVERIGAASPRKVDIRIIAATNSDLEKAVQEKRFREDLFYRLNVFHIHIPPLSERREDIPLLAAHFEKIYAGENGLPEREIERAGINYLAEREWPGNIRELENVVERAVAMSEEDVISLEDLGGAASGSAETGSARGSGLDEMVAGFERRLIRKALEGNGWRQNRAAEQLGISERSIWYKIKKLGIEINKPPGK